MNQDIKCSVDECKHHSGTSNCSLKDIQVSGTSGRVEAKNDTGCMSFENSNK